MSRFFPNVAVRLGVLLTMLVLAAGCDLGPLLSGTSDPPTVEASPVPSDTVDDSAADDADAETGGSTDGTATDGESGEGAAGDDAGDAASAPDPDDPEDAFAGDMANMPEVDPAALLEGSAGRGELRIRESDDPLPSEDGPFPGIGTFRVFCEFSHQNFDDPIVFPGQPGASHLHTFFGNTATDATSTAGSLAGGGNSTCQGGIADRSAYWIPTVIDTSTDTPIAPSIGAMYYQSGFSGVESTSIQAIPEGLKMIAGDPTRTPGDGGDDPFAGFNGGRWGCFDGGGAPETQGDGTTIPDCPAGQSAEMIINFPQCWDGEHLDSDDHRGHMAYPAGGDCPESHPVAIPALMMAILFPVDAGGTADWRLASDMYTADEPGGASLHADFVNGWDREIMDRWIDACIRPELDCERSELGDGEGLF